MMTEIELLQNTQIQNQLRLLYNRLQEKTALLLYEYFNKSPGEALRTVEALLTALSTKQVVLRQVYKKRIMRLSDKRFEFRIRSSKLEKLEKSAEMLKNSFGLDFDSTIILNVYDTETLKRVAVLDVKKSSRIYYAKANELARDGLDKKFLCEFTFRDYRIQLLLKLLTRFIHLRNRVLRGEFVVKPHAPQPRPSQGGGDNFLEMIIQLNQNKYKRTKKVVKKRTVKSVVDEVEQNRQQEEDIDDNYYNQLRKVVEEIADERVREIILTNEALKDLSYYKKLREMSFKEFYEEYQNNLELASYEVVNKQFRHILQLYRNMKRFVDFLQQNKLRANADAIVQFYKYLKYNKKLAQNTVDKYMTAIRFFFMKLDYEQFKKAKVEIEKLKTTVDRKMKLIKQSVKREVVIYKKEDVEHFLEQIYRSDLLPEEKDNLALLIALLWNTGMRITEAMRLRLRDVDLENRVILVRADNSKTYSARYTFITEDTAEFLKCFLKKYPRAEDDFLINLSLKIFNIKKKQIEYVILKHYRVNLPKLKFFRKTFTTLIKHGTTLKELEERLAGHTGEIAEKHYDLTKISIQQLFFNKERNRELYELILRDRELYDAVFNKITCGERIFSKYCPFNSFLI